jgi:hypothetical protein
MLALPKPGWLAAVRPADSPSASSLPAGSEITVADGQIAGALRLLSVDGRRRKAIYELLIANQTPMPLAAFAYGVGRPNPAGRLRWNAITVPALSSVAVPISIDLPKRGSLRRVVAELHGDGAQLVVDAPPPASFNAGAAWRSGILITGLLLGALGATGYALERPRVVALTAPAQVRAGRPFEVAYTLGPGMQHARYTIAGPQGDEIAKGSLNPRGGTLKLNLPAGRADARYQVRLQADGPLGSTTQSTSVLALASSGARPAWGLRIDNATLEKDTVQGGRPIVIRAQSGGAAGTVKLLDQDGTERAEALLGAHGSTILIAPFVDTDQDFRVVIDAHRGSQVLEKQLPVRIARGDNAIPSVEGLGQLGDGGLPPVTGAAAPPVSDSASVGTSNVAAAPAPVVATGGDPIALTKSVYRNGEPVIVSVQRSVSNLRVVMIDATGTEVQSVDVAPDETQVELTPPPVTADTHFTVVATYSRGPSEESIIHSVLVRAK